MSNVIKLESIRTIGFFNQKDLSDSYETVRDEADGFVMIYRNKEDHCYYIHSSGLTKTEGVFASQLLRDLAMYGADTTDVDPDGGESL